MKHPKKFQKWNLKVTIQQSDENTAQQKRMVDSKSDCLVKGKTYLGRKAKQQKERPPTGGRRRRCAWNVTTQTRTTQKNPTTKERVECCRMWLDCWGKCGKLHKAHVARCHRHMWHVVKGTCGKLLGTVMVVARRYRKIVENTVKAYVASCRSYGCVPCYFLF